MEKYLPIDCNFYDLIEHFATLKQVVQIEYLDENDKLQSIKTIIVDTQTTKDGEYMLLKPYMEQVTKIRMDAIISIEDKRLADFNSCQVDLGE